LVRPGRRGGKKTKRKSQSLRVEYHGFCNAKKTLGKGARQNVPSHFTEFWTKGTGGTQANKLKALLDGEQLLNLFCQRATRAAELKTGGFSVTNVTRDPKYTPPPIHLSNRLNEKRNCKIQKDPQKGKSYKKKRGTTLGCYIFIGCFVSSSKSRCKQVCDQVKPGKKNIHLP